MFSRFERIPACDRRPDCYDSIVRAMHIESRGKNWHYPVLRAKSDYTAGVIRIDVKPA